MKIGHQITRIIFSKKLVISAVIMLALMIGSLASASAKPAPHAPRVIPPGMSCGVCGMHPAKFIKWQTQIIFKDGSMVPFDGGKDMFKYILNMAKFDNKHTRKSIAAIWVKDFNSGKWFDGHKAVYVIGSSVMGPMGKELIPFMTPESAGKFKAANMGAIKRFPAITMEDIKKLGMGGMKMNGMGGMKMNSKGKDMGKM